MDNPRLGHIGHHILLTLADTERHGYSIMKQIALDTNDDVRIGPATLYTTLKRLLEQDLIEESSERTDPELDDARRRYYRLTAHGMSVLEEEIARAQRFIQVAIRRS